MTVPPVPVRVPSQRPLAPNVASVTSVASGKGDNEMILAAVHRSPAICLTAEETSARRPSDEGAVPPVIASNGVPFLQMRSVGSHSTSGREKEGIKERMGDGMEYKFYHLKFEREISAYGNTVTTYRCREIGSVLCTVLEQNWKVQVLPVSLLHTD